MWKFFVNSSTLPNRVTGKLHRDKVLEKGRQTPAAATWGPSCFLATRLASCGSKNRDNFLNSIYRPCKIWLLPNSPALPYTFFLLLV